MHTEPLRQMLAEVRAGRLTVDEAMARLSNDPKEEPADLRLDLRRAHRTGYPETIYGAGKNVDQLERAVSGLAATGDPVLVTRLDPTVAGSLVDRFPGARWHEAARVFELPPRDRRPEAGVVAVVAAGTSDLAVAEEAAVTAGAFGVHVERFYDVGVAGLHRLVEQQERLREIRVVIVVAGMEGALASVVGGLFDAVVIAVPTSVGYGASFAGLAALLAMLNSCAAGVLVVNIDNGHGAGLAAARISRFVHGGGASE